jgi:preprotein translocase subunit SecA
MGFLSKISDHLDSKELKKFYKISNQVEALEEQFKQLSEEQLQGKTAEFKERIANGETLDSLLPEAFATVREAASRTLGMRHFPVQIIGGIILHQGNIAEMKTGEGKTLVATLPAYLNALSGKGVHIITVNDYLATRDADWMNHIYSYLGLSVGLVIHEMTHAEKKQAYACDITYGTNNEFGFDYLRDNMVLRKDQMVQRNLNYAIVDEVDSILIDEARTPLIISGSSQESTKLYLQADVFVRRLKNEADFTTDEKARTVTLTEDGVTRAESYFGIENLSDLGNMELLHHINQALKANYMMKRDVDYVVNDGEIVIVDEFTGRLMPGRRYNEGLHQAIEAKEHVKVARESVTLATITFQNYFRMYEKLSGMTGTAKTEEQEFRTIYQMDVVNVPTNMPLIRDDMHDVVYKTEHAKFDAVVEEIKERHQTGQPILVGTISIEKSELLSKMLNKQKIKHQVLNAKQHQKEAEIISGAGQMNAVTISTNMAGRGTDIVLGDGVKELGGLHIIGTERHESRRIDNQLRGRAGRQGDPGSSQFFVSLEDDLMRMFGSERTMGLMDKIGLEEDMPIESGMLTKGIENAQKNVEGRNFGIRKYVLQYDDVMNKQREVIYAQRKSVLEGEDISDEINDMIAQVCQNYVMMYTAGVESSEEWELDKLNEKLKTYFGVEVDFSGNYEPEEMAQIALEKIMQRRTEIEEKVGAAQMREIERIILLRIVDSKWMEHIDNMDQLKQGINLRAYGQTDPVQAYTKEGFEMFEEMNATIIDETVRYLFNFKLQQQPKIQEKQLGVISTNQGASKEKIKREGHISKNAPCPCGSGKKYKRCCGKEE